MTVSKHDKITRGLEDLLRQDFEVDDMNTEYGDHTRVFGEIDYFMYKKGHLWLFEVKCNPNNTPLYNKAIKQMKRAVKPDMFIDYFQKTYKLAVNHAHTFYVTNAAFPINLSGKAKNRWIRPVVHHLETVHYNTTLKPF